MGGRDSLSAWFVLFICCWPQGTYALHPGLALYVGQLEVCACINNFTFYLALLSFNGKAFYFPLFFCSTITYYLLYLFDTAFFVFFPSVPASQRVTEYVKLGSSLHYYFFLPIPTKQSYRLRELGEGWGSRLKERNSTFSPPPPKCHKMKRTFSPPTSHCLSLPRQDGEMAVCLLIVSL